MTAPHSPHGPDTRIDALDVLRGFALLGICLVNVEYFNRPVAESGSGIPAGLQGLDWLAAWVLAYFFTGKFWIIFTLLFGMGFALLLERARQAGRPFFPAYLRRIAALGVFGLLHHTFLWGGDILISYTAGALLLLVTLFGQWRPVLAAIVACIALSLLPEPWGGAGMLVAPLVFAGLLALYLRGAAEASALPLLLILPGGLILALALVQFPGGGNGDTDTWLLALGGAALVALGLVLRRHGGAGDSRMWRAGVVIFVLIFGMMATAGGLRYFSPGSGAATPATTTGSAGSEAGDAKEHILRLRERARRSAEESTILTQGSYTDAVAMRARHLGVRLPDEPGFSILLVGVFLIGAWCVRSSIVADIAAHRPLLRRLVSIGLPLGIGLGLAGSLIATGRSAGIIDSSYDLAEALLMLGSLPASLGYVAAVLLLFQRWPGIGRALAPLGRMALTNYLMQSLVLSLLFYGYGAGLWGMGRAGQAGVALALCALQAVGSSWWLRRFQYGPLEWLWRLFTYLTLPPWRVGHHKVAIA